MLFEYNPKAIIKCYEVVSWKIRLWSVLYAMLIIMALT